MRKWNLPHIVLAVVVPEVPQGVEEVCVLFLIKRALANGFSSCFLVIECPKAIVVDIGLGRDLFQAVEVIEKKLTGGVKGVIVLFLYVGIVLNAKIESGTSGAVEETWLYGIADNHVVLLEKGLLSESSTLGPIMVMTVELIALLFFLSTALEISGFQKPLLPSRLLPLMAPTAYVS